MLVERLLAQAIQDFEPRIIPSTLKVKLDLEPATMSHHAMNFDIEGELWAQPLPLRIRLRTQLALEAGQMSIADLDRAGGRGWIRASCNSTPRKRRTSARWAESAPDHLRRHPPGWAPTPPHTQRK